MIGKHGRSIGTAAILIALIALQVGCQAPQAAPPVPTSAPAAPAPATQAAAPTAVPKPAAATPAPAPAPTLAPTPAPETLKIGLSVGLSGPAARLGMITERFLRLSFDDVNAKGGVKVGGKVYRLEAVTVDDKGTSDGGREAANRLALAEKVKFIAGTFGNPWAGAQPVTEPNKVLTLAATAIDRLLGPASPLTFVTFSQPTTRQAVMYEWLTKAYPNAKRVAIIEGDDVNGHTTADGSEVNIKAKGLAVAAKEFYPLDIKDFNPLATRVLRQSPDAIDIGVGGARGVLFLPLVKALSEQGFKGPIVAASINSATLQENLKIMEGITSALLIDYKSSLLSPTERDIYQRYVGKYGENEIEAYSIANYNGPLILAQALEKAGTVDDTSKVAETLRAGEWNTIYGKGRFMGVKTFGLSHVLEQPIYLNGIRDGKLVTLDRIVGNLP